MARALFVYLAIYVFKIMKSIGSNTVLTIFSIIMLLVPCLGLLVLLSISSRATGALEDAGLKVGLMGVSKAQLEELRAKASAPATPPPLSQ